MTGTIITYDGIWYALPAVLEWKFEYGTSSPCDSFQLEFLWESEQAEVLSKAVRFVAEENGKRVFTGVVDEFVVQVSEAGSKAELSGRGMAALLLDNEAEAADYDFATWSDILRRHVIPYGIETTGTPPAPASGFSVAYGSSEWQAVHEFARYYGGTVPRFDRMGRLVTGPWDDSRIKLLDDTVAVTALRRKEKRYGVLSQVMVRDKNMQSVEVVQNSAFLAEGGQCRRWYTMPKSGSYQAMRYQGQYQLERSQAERYQTEVTIPTAFFAFPGDLVQVSRSGWVCNGRYRVAQAVTGENGDGAYTTLLLTLPDLVG